MKDELSKFLEDFYYSEFMKGFYEGVAQKKGLLNDNYSLTVQAREEDGTLFISYYLTHPDSTDWKILVSDFPRDELKAIGTEEVARRIGGSILQCLSKHPAPTPKRIFIPDMLRDTDATVKKILDFCFHAEEEDNSSFPVESIGIAIEGVLEKMLVDVSVKGYKDAVLNKYEVRFLTKDNYAVMFSFKKEPENMKELEETLRPIIKNFVDVVDRTCEVIPVNEKIEELKEKRDLYSLANFVLYNDLSDYQIEDIKDFLFTHDTEGNYIYTFAESLAQRGIDFDVEEFRKELEGTIWEDYLNDLSGVRKDGGMEL